MLHKLKNITLPLLTMLTFSYLSLLMLQICAAYFPWTGDNSFLVLKQDLIGTQPWQWAFQTHVIASCFCLLAGFTQFFKILRQTQFKTLHRLAGYLYIISVLVFSLPSGLILALNALGGLTTQVSFILLSVLWGISTCLALYCAIKKQWLQHQYWMIRSFALTLSALSLRTWKIILYELSPYYDWLTPVHIYQLESWLGWSINLLIAEMIIYRIKRNPKKLIFSHKRNTSF